MNNTNLDDLQENIQQAIISSFSSVNIKDKIIFLTRLKYGNDLSYKEISEATGITFQRAQQIYDSILCKIKNSPYLIVASGVL